VSSLSFALSTTGGLTTGGINISAGGIPRLFAQNPANPNQYVITNGAGSLITVTNGSAFRPFTSPFSRFEPQTAQENQYFVTDVEWSPNGQYLAYIIDGDRFHPDPTNEDGVHVYFPGSGESIPLLRDAPYEGHPGYQAGGPREFLSESLELQWSPQSNRILARGRITNPEFGGQGVLFVLNLDQNPSVQPRSLRYTYGSWTNDGGRLVVSGRRGDGLVMIGVVNTDGSGEEILFNASAAGMWVQNAVQRPNGQIVALGGGGGAAHMIDSTGAALTGDIGFAAPSRVAWSPDRSAVFVEAGGRRYVATVSGGVQDITDSAAGASAVNWVTGSLPPGAAPSASPGTNAPEDGFIPAGVVEGSRYSPGQQLRVLVESLNVRAEPNVNAEAVASLFQGEYVAILAGPAPADNLTWWRVQIANGAVGWIAAEINGFATIGQ
jgi:hypothetical protein